MVEHRTAYLRDFKLEIDAGSQHHFNISFGGINRSLVKTGGQWLYGEHGSGDRKGEMLIGGIVRTVSPWATPPVQDSENTAGPSQFFRNSQALNVQAVVATPPTGQTTNGASEAMEKRGALSPAFVFWLMGFPDVWVSCALEAMQSFPSRRRK